MSPSIAEPDDEPKILLLDACVVINLVASGHIGAILGALDVPCAIVSHVQRETLHIRRGGRGDDAGERIAIDLTDLLAQGLLHVVADASEDELNTFIDFTLELGDGEAMTAALALHRGHAVATDDRVALKVLAARVPTVSSLDLIKRWADRQRISSSLIKTALRDLRQRGSYLPGSTHPLRSWWDRYYDRE
jgi:predicted nucleic acid-binding protein